MRPKTHLSAAVRWRRRRDAIRKEVLSPPERLRLSEWADRYRKLPKLTAEPGPWRTARVPYLREIMDAFTDPAVERIVVMKSAQVGYTEGIVNNAIGFVIHQKPSGVIVVQPTLDDAERYSKKKLALMIEETPALRERIPEAKSRDANNTILEKQFPGGFLSLIGAKSPRGLRSQSAPVLLCDEVDAYEASAEDEGDPIKLAEKRTQTFRRRKIVLGSTPKLKGSSRIESEYAASDRRRYHVPCPHCSELQPLEWGGPNSPYGLKWDRAEVDGRVIDHPETAAYLCRGCGVLIEEKYKGWMLARGTWVAQNPAARVRGYHLNALYSPFAGARWRLLVEEWLAAQGDVELLQVFVNTVLGESWEERGESVSTDGLAGRAEAYVDAKGDGVEVPAGVAELTAGVDVQGDRLEVVVKGWGEGEESWLIAHHRLYGDPEAEDVWRQLEHHLSRGYRHASGETLRVRACMIDSGYATTAVYRFTKPRQRRGVYASKGVDGWGAPPVSRATRANKDGVKLFRIGTFALKRTVLSRLQRQQPGPGYMHFCAPTSSGADAEYFAQFGAEKLVPRKVNGRLRREYKQVRVRNEAIDLEVLALAALHARGEAVRSTLGRRAAKLAERAAETDGGGSGQAAAPAHRSPRPRRRGGGGWVSRF